VKLVKKDVERAVVILKLHELYPDDEDLKCRDSDEFLFKTNISGDRFVYEDTNFNYRYQGIGACLVEDIRSGHTINTACIVC
jgi:hypothetical protein